jgi:hypothetical protein
MLVQAESLAARSGCELMHALHLVETAARPFQAPETFAVDPAGARLHARAVAFQLQHPDATYLDAVSAVEAAYAHGSSATVLHLRSGSSFELRAEAGAVAAGTTFSGVAYSGGPVPNYGWHGDMAIDLASMTLPQGEVAVLLNHDPNQVVGRARVMNDGRQLTIHDGRLSSVTEEGRKVAGLLDEGQPWALSIGVNGRMEAADRAKPAPINGRTLAVDTVMRSARLLEVSFVPAGADPDALVR